MNLSYGRFLKWTLAFFSQGFELNTVHRDNTIHKHQPNLWNLLVFSLNCAPHLKNGLA